VVEPSILVLSGWAFPEPSLAPLRRALEPIGPVRVIEPDPAGLDELRRALLVDSATRRWIVGWSLGGMLAVEALACSTARVAGLIVVGSTPRFCSSPDFPYGVAEARVRALRSGLRRDPGRTLARFYQDCAAPEAPLAAEPSWEPPESALLRRGLDYLLQRDLRSALSRVAAPCAVVHGAEDRVVPKAAGAWLAEALKAPWTLVEGVGHDLPLRRPELLARIARELGRETR
jgi:pimeloyl-[acyl-carrier protein] methyl ester esterase